ncbi:unnamed protein product [Nyctereutes procyonoides]|uniref:(raccoon dog) hypothetical protein n=1 Tax=Nyctereutes procyonoides TaxID=34880 RepID=A0A811ZU66_NYCPR|nr:unnamed protein product [Nyctereutes procyonoides]
MQAHGCMHAPNMAKPSCPRRACSGTGTYTVARGPSPPLRVARASMRARSFCSTSAHTSKRPFIVGSSSLAHHWCTHTGEQPYACPDCSKAFCGSSELHRPQGVHSGEKPFVCTDCGKAFVGNSELLSHRCTHTGKGSYVCLVCSKPFSHRSNLNEHQNQLADRAAP